MADKTVPYLWSLALLCLWLSDKAIEKGQAGTSHGLMGVAGVLFFVIPLVLALIEASKAYSQTSAEQLGS